MSTSSDQNGTVNPAASGVMLTKQELALQVMANKPGITIPAPPQISYVITLHNWISLDQYNAIIQVIVEGIERYSAFIQGYTVANIPPSVIDYRAEIVMTGVDPVTTYDVVVQTINDAFASVEGFVAAHVQPAQ